MTIQEVQDVLDIATWCRRHGLIFETDDLRLFILNNKRDILFDTLSVHTCQSFMKGYVNGLLQPQKPIPKNYYMDEPLNFRYEIQRAILVSEMSELVSLVNLNFEVGDLHYVISAESMVAHKCEKIEDCYGFLDGYVRGRALPRVKVTV